MKRILIIAASLKVGGAEKVARDICLRSDPNAYEFHYVVFGDEVGDYERDVVEHGGKVFHLESPAKSYRQYMKALKALMGKYRYHAVHAHTMFSCGWAMLASKKAGVPVRVTHAHSALDTGNRLDKKLYEKVMRRMILKNATDLVACGEKAGIRLFGEKAYRKRGKLILNGVDVEAFRFNESKRQAIRKKFGWQDALVIGHVGHLASVKNQSFLLELMPEILKRQPNARLLLLGEGEDRAILEDKIRELGLEEKVRLPGNVTNVEDYLSAMDVFVFPSLYEGMPLSVLEVQANGLPCVISTGVPRDVYLTDLIHPLSLADDKKNWIDRILSVKRSNPYAYALRMEETGFGLQGSMDKMYQIYDRK